jgi:hypothetical protein
MSGSVWRYLPRRRRHVFACCDESGIDADSRWLVIGGFWLPDDRKLAGYEGEVVRLRQETGCWGEFKWTSVDPRWLDAYLQFLDTTLALPGLAFKCMVVDKDLYTPEMMKLYHPGGEDEAYVKFVRFVIKAGLRRFIPEGHAHFTVLYDRMNPDRELVRKFRKYLLADVTAIAGRNGTEASFDHLCSVNSASRPLMQSADLFVGAIRSAWTGYADSSGKAKAREAIRERLTAWSGYGLKDSAQPHDDKYDLWQWKP